jgi:hypothetical protein
VRVTIATTAALAAALLATPALAGPGGHLAGSFTAAWPTAGGSGQVSVQLDPGTAARDAAVARIKAVQHFRTGSPFTTEGAHVSSLSVAASSSFDCGEGDGSTSKSTTTFGAIQDAETPFVIDLPELDLLRGTGTTHMNPAWDNAGDPLPETGRDFFPVPGQVAVNRSFQPCPSQGDFPQSEDDVAPIFGAGSDQSAVPFGIPIYLQSFDVPLREHNGTWSATGSVHDKVLGSLPIDLSYDVKLVGPLSSWTAICVVPADRDLAKARSAKAAVSILKRAGFPHARYGGKFVTRYHRHGRYFVDEKFTSSGFSECLKGKPRVFLAS